MKIVHHFARILGGGLFALFVGACSEEVKLPPAAPLQAAESEISTLHGANKGPHTVARALGLSLPGQGEQRELQVNLYYPEQGRGYPLLLFSHGNWSDNNSYDAVIEHWVSHGYAVVATNHLDCCGAPRGILNSLRYGQLTLVTSRSEDLVRLINEVDTLETLHPPFAGKSDVQRLAATGHSFGAFSAQQLGGAQVFDPDQQRFIDHRDPRVRAVVAISPPGPMFDTITADSWQQLQAPTLVSTGSWDIQPRFWPDWRMHLMSYQTALPGDKYALTTEGADHYFGGLICRLDQDAEPQEDALRMLKIASTAFLDAYLKDSESAKLLISSAMLDERTKGFSQLQRR
jgi:predicted dienelactone hydrolase